MPRDPSIATLAQCGRECLQASDGRGRRWAVERCRRTLEAGGTPSPIAERSARAMAELAVWLRSQGARPLQG